jgi:ABC-2 type transport system ATP-binding protein
MSSLIATEISKKYDSFQVLSPASFKLNAGEIAILSGPNGSGKTTLLSCLAGLTRPTTGTVTVGGFDLYQDEVEVRKQMAYVPDVPRFYLELTAWEHLRFIAAAHSNLSGFEPRAKDLLGKLGLWDARNLFPHHYSRGMRLKLGLALAFIRRFEVLLLDEPTSALDQESVDMMKEELRNYRAQGAAILLTTHDPQLIEQLPDRKMAIRSGVVELS